ncbi:MAG: Gfo/Idh/MocA family oxidoreductase [Saprospiraceae bacterium]|nr:Gfo/Idh/MocA family oxidoreductase [Saprospiraceae bacterium]
MKNISRRNFISSAASTAATFTIVPSHVMAGSGKVPPSDKITVANIGCGTQGLREMGDLLTHDEIQVVSVCDPNKMTNNYLDWSPHGLRDGIRRVLDDPSWGEGTEGIVAGRDVAKKYIEQYYGKNKPSGNYQGCSVYEDFRELLEEESDIDVLKIMTPDHLHATIAMAGMRKGLDVITHKPIANRMYEARKTIEMAKSSGRKTHLLAWHHRPEYAMVLKWIQDGVIGNLKEIHNWSYRPVWPQFTGIPKDRPPIPEGFNWDLWLGPVPHRPYHPNYTHNVFRGWYEFGGGSVADMGHYSLFPLFRAFEIETPPHTAKAYGTTLREADNGVCKWIDNDVAFPHSCLIKLSFPEQKLIPAFDLFWYDGGMKPFAPEELEMDDRDIPNEGMMFVGDQGKILAGFRCEEPEIIPAKRMEAYQGEKKTADRERENGNNEWVSAFKAGKESPGSFIYAGPVTETINLAAVALRAKKKIKYDHQYMKITNDRDANGHLYREYRFGWEI